MLSLYPQARFFSLSRLFSPDYFSFFASTAAIGTGGRHTDWWALGVLAHEMITGRSPWSSLTDKKLIKRQIRSLCIVPPRGVSTKAGQFICRLLTQDHRERLGTRSSNDVKHDAFFAAVDWVATAAGTAPAAL